MIGFSNMPIYSIMNTTILVEIIDFLIRKDNATEQSNN